MRLALLGVALVLSAALTCPRLMRGLLYGMCETDPATFFVLSLLS